MSGAIDSVLIPTDGSAGALAGAKIGIALAARTGADVHVLSVVRVPELAELTGDETISPLEADAREATEAVAELAAGYDEQFDVTTAVRRGTPFQSIREYANRREIDVISMGTNGRTGLNRFLLGSVTENVLRTARTPVLVVPSAAGVASIDDATFDRVLLPTDGSQGAEIATEWGMALATAVGASVRALSVVDVRRYPGHSERERVRDALEDRGQEALETVRGRGDTAGVDVSGSIEAGSPANVILGAVTDADLVVMGTHGQTGVGQWFLGSVTENVVRQSEIPVLCVPISAETP